MVFSSILKKHQNFNYGSYQYKFPYIFITNSIPECIDILMIPQIRFDITLPYVMHWVIWYQAHKNNVQIVGQNVVLMS